jgi:gas vesicle protein
MSKNTGGMFLAGIIGALAGAVGGLLMAPQSGKETREAISKLALQISKNIKTETTETKKRVADIFGKANEEVIDKYNEVKNTVVSKVATIKTAGEEINKEKYGKLVEDVVAEFKEDLSSTKSAAEKIVVYLKKDWEKVKKAIA